MAEDATLPVGDKANPQQITVNTFSELWDFLLENSLQNRHRISGEFCPTFDGPFAIDIVIRGDGGEYHYQLSTPDDSTLTDFIARLEARGVFHKEGEHASVFLPERLIEIHEAHEAEAKTRRLITIRHVGLEIAKVFLAAILASIIPYFCTPKQAEVALLRTEIQNSVSVAAGNKAEIARLRQDITAIKKPTTISTTTRKAP